MFNEKIMEITGNENYREAITEFDYCGYDEMEKDDKNKYYCLCGQEIRIIHYLSHRNNIYSIGCECIKKYFGRDMKDKVKEYKNIQKVLNIELKYNGNIIKLNSCISDIYNKHNYNTLKFFLNKYVKFTDKQRELLKKAIIAKVGEFNFNKYYK